MLVDPDLDLSDLLYESGDAAGTTVTAADYDDDDLVSQQTTSSSFEEPILLGFVLVNIVGLRYYSGTIRGRELVGLVREPLNPHDPNAIKVLNSRAAQVGHIERTAAAALAPLLDSHVATLEAIVPNPPKSRAAYRLPCQVHIFARPPAADIVRDALAAGGLHLICLADHEFSLSDSVIVRESKDNAMSKRSERGIDELFTLVGEQIKGIELAEPPKDTIVSELFEHQKLGLGWMAKRENSNDLPPFWEENDGGFLNVLTNHQTSQRPEPLKGGILADDMGLGKTLTLLSLVALNRPTSQITIKKVSRGRKKQKVDDYGGGPLRTTLVVCPKSVLSTWISQLEEHTKQGSLKVYLYYQERIKNCDELLKNDIVLTTYNTLASEFDEVNSPLDKVEWLRVILDEAHVIKNVAAKQTKAVIALKAERRWAVTGTPIQNSSFDLFSLMAFLRFQPFSIKSYWQSLVQRPLDQGHKSGLSRLQALIGTISLRRTKGTQEGKNLVGLPSKTVETCLVELSAEEREQYDRMESEAQNTLREYLDADTVLRNYSTVLHILLRLRQICNDVALCPSDLKTFISSNGIEDASKNPELLMKLVTIIEDGDDFDCPICLSPPSKTVITSCTHIFCQTCILKILKVKAQCPLCRRSLSKSELFLAPPRTSTDDSTSGTSDRQVSSKVSALLKLLQTSKKENPSRKSVVFSQFRKMLILLEVPLKAAGFTILRLDGSMTMKKRTEVIREFSKVDPDAPTILLASIKVAGAGINLTAASRVYLLEPWWNPAVEEQAMDRVHRIGQQEEVRIVRLIVKDSIEERVLELQEKKQQLASGAFGRKAAKEQAQVRVEDIRTMIRL